MFQNRTSCQSVAPRASCLYPREEEVARLIFGAKRPSASEWKAIAIVLERSGLPKADPLMGGRYWPAVVAWFDRRHGLASTAGGYAVDGKENWDYGRKRKGASANAKAYQTSDGASQE